MKTNHRALAAPTLQFLRLSRDLQEHLSLASLSASGSDSPIWEQSSLTLSSHCFFDLPTGLVPWMWPYNITFGYLDGFILTTCPKYVKRRVWMTSTISRSKCSSLRISTFLKRALLVIPSILRKTDISNTRSVLLLSSLRVQVSALYKSIDWTSVSYT